MAKNKEYSNTGGKKKTLLIVHLQRRKQRHPFLPLRCFLRTLEKAFCGWYLKGQSRHFPPIFINELSICLFISVQTLKNTPQIPKHLFAKLYQVIWLPHSPPPIISHISFWTRIYKKIMTTISNFVGCSQNSAYGGRHLALNPVLKNEV